MPQKKFDKKIVEDYLKQNKIATLDQLKTKLKTSSTMTVFRKLKNLDYLSSYSHRGKYYTLNSLAEFNEIGLYSFRYVWFSKFGSLVETTKEFIEQSNSGFTASELEKILHVEVKHTLLQLFQKNRICREKISNRFVYFSLDTVHKKQQITLRKSTGLQAGTDLSYEIVTFRDELKAAIILFFSLLNEQQRRLYAGLEAFKLGHGGDKKIAQLLGLDVHTVAKGRKELLSGEIQKNDVRKKGGGRKPMEKKSQKSSTRFKKS